MRPIFIQVFLGPLLALAATVPLLAQEGPGFPGPDWFNYGLPPSQQTIPLVSDGWPDPLREFASQTLSLVFTGDNKLAGRTAKQIARYGEEYPYELVAEVISGADLAFCNLENAITSHPHKTPGKSWESIKAGRNFIFKCDPEYSGRILADAGYDIVSLANNHAMDYCAEGLVETMQVLDESAIAYVGGGMDATEAGSARMLECNGEKVGFLAYSMIVPAQSKATEDTPGLNPHARKVTDEMLAAVASLSAQADVVVVTCHWGVEGSRTPARYQKDIAHAVIDAGADLVIGHHPHCPQGVEFYNGGVVAYSLGNFQFTGKSSVIDSFILRVETSGGAVTKVEILPVWVRTGRPEPAFDDRLLTRLRKVMKPLKTEVTESGEWLVLAPPEPDDR